MNKILIVDDSAENADRMIDYLNETDVEYMFYQALNGAVACKIAEKKLPDLIITDWDMPDMDGISLIKCLKSTESTKDIPIIMCTGVMTTTENLKTALDVGAVDYIRKPVEKLELIARVHSMMKLSASIKKVKKQNLLLAELNATKDKFISILAHDLRSPFNSLIGFSELLKEEVANDSNNNIKLYANTINDEAKSTFNFLEELLEWAKMQINRASFNPESVCLLLVVEECVSLLSNLSKAKNLYVKYDIPADLVLFADMNMLKTILRNIVSNAIKFTHQNGLITITADIKKFFCEIIVSDTGIGMDKKTLTSLFKISETKSGVGTMGERGSGFGLLLSKEYIEKHGGTISVESALGEGSIFKFTLPLCND
jgi:signal transduction histidine kinase